jgi:hypothetical protein
MISTHEADRQIERLALHVILAHIWRLELDVVFDIVKALVVVLAIELVHHIFCPPYTFRNCRHPL